MSDQLQSKSLDFASATSLVLSTKETLQELRTNESWEQTYTYIKSVADLHGIDKFLRTPVKERGHPGESKIQSYLSQLVIEIYFHVAIVLKSIYTSLF